MEFVAQLVDQMIDRAGHLNLNICVRVLAKERQRFPVKDHLDIRKSTHAPGPNLVGPVERHCARTCQPEFLPILGDDIKG